MDEQHEAKINTDELFPYIRRTLKQFLEQTFENKEVASLIDGNTFVYPFTQPYFLKDLDSRLRMIKSKIC